MVYTWPMSWAAQRRLIILFSIGGFIVLVVGLFSYLKFHKAPSCTDGIQNQNETGIDCGGSCPYLCTADELPPTVLFTQAVPGIEGQSDAVALVENKNPDAAAKAVPYTITLYGAGRSLIQIAHGTLDLPPNSSMPVFLPGIVSGQQAVQAAFLTIDPSQVLWTKMSSDPRLLPQVSNTQLGGASSTPRVTATLADSSVRPLTNVRVIVLVRDGGGNVIGASQTIVPAISGQSQATATFTWNEPFPGTPVSIEVLPVIPLP